MLLASCVLVTHGCDTASEPSASTLADMTSSCTLAEAPRCLAGCGQIVEVSGPDCRSGRWSCPAGIDSRICCDAERSPEGCPVWEDRCDRRDDLNPCPAGYTCVTSHNFPTPAATGICRLGELDVPAQMSQCGVADATPASYLPLLSTGPVKVQGMLVVDTLCGSNTCLDGNPCCNACYGNYRLVLDGGVSGAGEVRLPINTESIACTGTTCGFSCTPMQPGARHVVWGSYIPSERDGDVGQLFYVGHCRL